MNSNNMNADEKEARAYFCPKCKSTKVRKEISITLLFGAPQKWICDKCKFRGYIFPQIQNNKGKNRRK